jgi:ABC-type transporter MlaC component
MNPAERRILFTITVLAVSILTLFFYGALHAQDKPVKVLPEKVKSAIEQLKQQNETIKQQASAQINFNLGQIAGLQSVLDSTFAVKDTVRVKK